jgi:hypothetical protein
MSRSAERAGRPVLAIVPADGSAPASRSRAPGADQQAAFRLVGLAIVGRVLRSRRVYERLLVAAIVAAALARLGKENGMSTIARLAAWNTREIQRLEHRAKRHGRGR